LADLDQASIIVLARNYNPSIVSCDWLVAKRILSGPFINFIHTPALSLVEEEWLSLIVDNNRLQMELRQPSAENTIRLREAALLFVQSLPETPYVAVGLNFRFRVHGSSLDLSTIVQPKKTKLHKLFGAGFEIGARVVFDQDGFRVTTLIPSETTANDFRHVSFNYHADVAGAAEAGERISRHGDAFQNADAIVTGLAPNG